MTHGANSFVFSGPEPRLCAACHAYYWQPKAVDAQHDKYALRYVTNHGDRTLAAAAFGKQFRRESLTSSRSFPTLGFNMSTTIRSQLIEGVDRLDEARRQRLLDLVRRTTAFRGTRGRDLLCFAGTIELGHHEEISRAIEEGCEAVNPNE
jgi:hypothetical protein